MATNVCVNNDQFDLDVDGRLEIKLGCGMEVGGDGVRPKVSSWPLDCDESNGADVYCDPATGKLKVRPRPRSAVVGTAGTDFTNHTIAPGDQFCVEAGDFTVNLTNYCDNQLLLITPQVVFDILFSGGGAQEYQVTGQLTVNGAGQGVHTLQAADGKVAGTYVTDRVSSQPENIVLPAGAVHTIHYTACVHNLGSYTFTLRSLQSFAKGLLITSNTSG